MPAEADRLLGRVVVGELQARAERRRVEREVLARAEGEGPVGIGLMAQLEDDLEGARRDDPPWPLPADAVQRMRRVGDVRARRVVAAAPAKAPVAEPVRVRHEREHRRVARRRSRPGSVERRIGVAPCQSPATAPPRSGRTARRNAPARSSNGALPVFASGTAAPASIISARLSDSGRPQSD